MMPKFVPPEILMTTLGFLPQMDLNNDMLVSKAWHNLIKGGGKQLPQLQEIRIDAIHHRRNVFMVDFSIDGKTVRLTEGKALQNEGIARNTLRTAQKKILFVEGREDVEFSGLKNSIVAEFKFLMQMVRFEEIFQKIKNLLGGQILPIKTVEICFDIRADHMQELSHFRDNYSSIIWDEGIDDQGRRGTCTRGTLHSFFAIFLLFFDPSPST